MSQITARVPDNLVEALDAAAAELNEVEPLSYARRLSGI